MQNLDRIINKKNSLQPLLDKAKKHEEHILSLQQEILSKAKQKTGEIEEKVEEGTSVVENFEKFFEKKTEVENLIAGIEKERDDLIQEHKVLEKKALAFDLATKSKTVTSQVKDLEKEMENVNKRRGKFKQDLEKLIKLIKG